MSKHEELINLFKTLGHDKLLFIAFDIGNLNSRNA